ncbi:MAG: hypothetical protein ACFHVJ_04840 [Aestuariibacter sp.]
MAHHLTTVVELRNSITPGTFLHQNARAITNEVSSTCILWAILKQD